MKDYSRKTTVKDRVIKNGERLFAVQVKNSFDGYYVTVDNMFEDIPMVIRNHTNPINEGLPDNKAIFLNSSGDFFHIGNLILNKDNKKEYIAVTEPLNQGIYSSYKIRPLNEIVSYIINGEEHLVGGILANKPIYKDGSYTNQENVFEDNEMRAVIIQYNNMSNKIKLFDVIMINNKYYKVVKVDKDTLKDTNDCGVLQLVVLSIPKHNIYKINATNNERNEINGVLKYARVKDKKLNSIAREFLCDYQSVKTGDYVEYVYDCDEKGTLFTEKYIVYNVPSMYDGYDISLIYRCLNDIKLLNDKGDIVSVPYYFEDNRTRIDKSTNTDYLKDFSSSFMIVIQENEVTKNFITRKIPRVILKGVAYEVTGIDNLDEGLLKIGLEVNELNPSTDAFEVADYYTHLSKINNNTSEIYIKGEDSIFKGLSWEYVLVGINNTNISRWDTDSPLIYVENQNREKCYIRVVEKYEVGTVVTLKAYDNDGKEYSKHITLE